MTLRTIRSRATLGLAAAGLAVAGLAGASGAAPVHAGQGTGDPVLAVSPSSVPADAYATVTITGTDYLVPPSAPGTDVFGGVYVFFGWVSDPARFGPSIRTEASTDGEFGFTYVYPGDGGDASTRDEGAAGGLMRLVSFTAGGESGESASDFMDRDGNWSTQLELRGSLFTYNVPGTSEVRTVDCQQVQCGIYTIGAHGKASATNERFTPLTFTGTPGTPPSTDAPVVASSIAPLPAEEPVAVTTPDGTVAADGAPGTTDAPPVAATGSGGSGNGVVVAAVGLGALAGLGSGVVWYRRRAVS